MGVMDDHDTCWNLDDFPFFPGVDLTLWLQIVLATLVVAGAGALLAVAAA
jgi:hypothetical protein